MVVSKVKGPKWRKHTYLWEPAPHETYEVKAPRAVDDLIDWGTWKQNLMADLEPKVRAMYEDYGSQIGQALTGNASYSVAELPELEDAIQARLDHVDALIDAAKDKLQDTVDEITVGHSPGSLDELLAAVNDQFDSFESSWADRFAANEVGSSLNEAGLIAANDTGVASQQTWNTMGDDAVRPAHDELDDVSVDIGEPFDCDGFDLYYPGDPDGPDDLVMGCRCWLTFDAAQADVEESELETASLKDVLGDELEDDSIIEDWDAADADADVDIDLKYSPDQERDDHGRFGSGGGAGVQEWQTSALPRVTDGAVFSKEADSFMETALAGTSKLAQRLADDDLDPEHERALDYYQGDGYRAVNGALRAGADLSRRAADTATALDALVGAQTFQRDVTLFRGVQDGRAQSFSDLKPGDRFTDRGFGSTSVFQSVADKATAGVGTVMQVDAPKGTPGLYLAGFGEGEVILGRDTTYEVLQSGQGAMRVRIVP